MNQTSSALLETMADEDADEDKEFDNIARIYSSVNLIQRSFRVLKTLWF
jgi:hypothetical protein